ncbi:DUF2851 family protein [Ktedonobacter racemifer]|uniref:Uncharacterized protein n=1 Tax=Ktedonobacter racemifer DSM 44963 TaxID=485913 RepID=D6TN50_KTERA|nr:hypothetical protein Krac_8527 [Ktedonobacter racemifer DSM 44963]
MLLLAEQSYRHLPDEIEVARRWWRLPLDTLLPLDTGETYQLLFAGRPGGSKGPDIRDAVLRPLASSSPLAPAGLRQVLQAPRLCGDVEFHVRASDWYAHHHESDRRYNQVAISKIGSASLCIRANAVSIVKRKSRIPSIAMYHARGKRVYHTFCYLFLYRSKAKFPTLITPNVQ